MFDIKFSNLDFELLKSSFFDICREKFWVFFDLFERFSEYIGKSRIIEE